MNIKATAENFSAPWLSQALEAAGLGVWFWDLATDELYIDVVQQSLTGLSSSNGLILADNFFSNIHKEDLLGMKEAVEQALRTNTTFRHEFRYCRDDGTTIWLGARGDAVSLSGTSHTHFAGVNWDISALKAAEFQAEMTAKEMAHRVKNLLALVSGIARMTAKNSADLDEFLPSFNTRLNAIAGVNQLILGVETRRATLANTVSDTLHSVDNSKQISMDVSEFELNPRAAQTLVLALNELATNAVKYGALAVPEGKVDLSIQVNPAADSFILRWDENRPEPLAEHGDKKGFGSQVLKSLTKATYNGQPEFLWRSNGMTYQCVWKASEMSFGHAPQA
ncbi:sensor histidine kinase [Pararhizobium sp. IMCC21322]|uniref:sensor histidine kinase n=1 Tax=Pararhizobium sp. IMCC21322 TaxID=3067903 RepID=UPI002742945F|nr:HWE histidine kinase domain-containing protein [Pararhizobium sp. IMCC21322]